jgi:ABC-type sugar transport system ATPase subunit
MADPFLQLTDITKTYPGVTALAQVSLAVAPGEVIGLVGENGAGKSTLMKILGGVVEPSSGQIHVDGIARDALTVPDAILAGIAFVHQELNLFDNLDAAANVFIGREPLYGGPLRLIDRKALYAQARPYFELLGVDFKPETMVSALSIGQRQLLEIIKALSLDARLIIMDEPTSSLTLSETERLLGIIADLKAKGVSVIFISHRLNELTECADRVIVLRDGTVVGHLDKARVTHGEMIRLMIGRDLKSLYLPPVSPPGAHVLEIAEARTETYPDHPVSLQVRRGEILGLAGLIGAGRTELARTIFGIDRLLGGQILLDGAPVEIAHAARGHRAGDFPGAGGSQAFRPAARHVDCREHLAAGPHRLCNQRHGAGRARHRQCGSAAPAPAYPGAPCRDRDGVAVGRQPAEGGAGKWLSMKPRSSSSTSRHAASMWAPRRISTAAARPRRCRCRHPDDLQRHGGGDRCQRPHRRHA